MRIYLPLEKFDEDQRLVYGYASTPALDSHGEIVRREAVAAALPDYMRFANIREMHQPSAVGVAQEAGLDTKGLRIAAKVVDDDAWAKVKAGVYKGLSIGGRVTKRDPDNAKIITGLELNEISLVDRPANPEAVIDVFKRHALAKEGRRNSAADQERVQQMHDTAVDLGAACPGADAGQGDTAAADPNPDADNSPDDQTDEAKAAGIGDLRKGQGDTLAKLIVDRLDDLSRAVKAQGARLDKLASQPVPAKYQLAARVVDKDQDGVAKREDDKPKTALDAIRKAHQNPIRVGFF